MSIKFSIGADPEAFLKDASNAYVSAVGKIGGTKYSPKPLPIGDGFMVQEDNVALEYNVPPSTTEEEFNSNIQKAMEYLGSYVNKMGLSFGRDSAVLFNPAQLDTPQALEFGCDPDFNAWKNGARNPRPKASDPTLRTCGGHVHIGYDFKHQEEIISFIKHMDLFTVASVLMDEGELRKELYGKAGAFRPQWYGVEYRTLSNFWIFEEKYRRWVHKTVDHALDAWQTNMIDIDSERINILKAINSNNKKIASRLIDQYNLPVC